MPYCPECRYEYRDGVVECPDCRVELVVHLPPEPVKPKATRDDRWAPLFVPGPDMEMWIIKNLLEAAGIPVIIRSQETTIYRTTMVMPTDRVICVPSSMLEEAREILQDAQAGSSELNWEVWKDEPEGEVNAP